MDLDEPWAHGGCVFPQPERTTRHADGGVTYETFNTPRGGLTLRQYYAGLAMQGYIAILTVGYTEKEIAQEAVAMADELIKALAEGK